MSLSQLINTYSNNMIMRLNSIHFKYELNGSGTLNDMGMRVQTLE